jgi:hypothetical protein
VKNEEEASFEKVADVMATYAVLAAMRWFHQNPDKTFDLVDLQLSISRHMMKRLPTAHEDGKAALDCGMCEIAVQTFLAEFQLAGVDAAKEVARPREPG